MPVRKIDGRVPACRARLDLLKEMEKYIQDRSAEQAQFAGEGYGKTFSVIAQDSLGSTEVLSVEELKVPLDPTTHRIQLDGTAYDSGGELFRVTITFATNPALATCRMRLTRATAEEAETQLNGMWHYLQGRICAYHASAFVRRFGAVVLIGMLVVGVLLACASAALFFLMMFNLACVAVSCSLLILSYTYFSWKTPHCALDTIDNEAVFARNRWFSGLLVTSVVIPIAVRVLLKVGFGL